MLLHRTPLPRTWARQARPVLRYVTAGGATLALVLLAACGSSTGTDGGQDVATLSGTVRASESATTLAAAKVSVGSHTATSDANGQFTLTGLPAGATTVQVQRAGYLQVEAALTITAGANSHDFTLSPQEIYVLGTTAVFVPAGVGPMRGVIIALGGPYTDGLVTGGQIEPNANAPLAEALLQDLGTGLRSIARTERMALVGNHVTMSNSAVSDNDLFGSLGTVAEMSGHAELTNAPVLMLGLSTGSPQAAGLASRHPERAVGLLVWLPPSVSVLTAPAALAVPTLVMLAELDDAANNAAVQATFLENRARGGLWALGVARNETHRPTAAGNSSVYTWIIDAIDLRLPTTAGQPLVTFDQTSGWLGDRATLDIAPWADFQGNRATASWLLSGAQAAGWKSFGQ